MMMMKDSCTHCHSGEQKGVKIDRIWGCSKHQIRKGFVHHSAPVTQSSFSPFTARVARETSTSAVARGWSGHRSCPDRPDQGAAGGVAQGCHEPEPSHKTSACYLTLNLFPISRDGASLFACLCLALRCQPHHATTGKATAQRARDGIQKKKANKCSTETDNWLVHQMVTYNCAC